MVAVPPPPHAPSPCPMLRGCRSSPGTEAPPADPSGSCTCPQCHGHPSKPGAAGCDPNTAPCTPATKHLGDASARPWHAAGPWEEPQLPAPARRASPPPRRHPNPAPGTCTACGRAHAQGTESPGPGAARGGSPLRRVPRDHRHCARGLGAAYLLPRGMGSVRAGTGPRAPRVSV